MVITVFLEVLILAFALGNALLFLVPKKKFVAAPREAPECIPIADKSTGFAGNNAAIEKVVLEERINVLNQRIARLESMIMRLSNKDFSDKINTGIAKKLLDLEEYRRNSHLEIEAVKQRLSDFRKELNLQPDNAKKKLDFDISNEKLHELVFNKTSKAAINP